jgi:hypothetical protein
LFGLRRINRGLTSKMRTNCLPHLVAPGSELIDASLLTDTQRQSTLENDSIGLAQYVVDDKAVVLRQMCPKSTVFGPHLKTCPKYSFT